MADKISFDLVSPEKLLLSDEAEMITIPGREGDMGVMAGHMPLISTLRPGTITVKGGAEGAEQKFFVAGGFAEVNAEKLTVLAEEALPMQELDSAALEARISAVEEQVKSAASESDAARAQELLAYLTSLRVTH
ncbi:MAG TPA: F0F1 ATP synthase subunit epsilon [Rhizomicrobium sp.]|nr:F0F1 ATP synthase subunit epsilon [Rhizomicrobium sp.]